MSWRVSPADAVFLHFERPNAPMHIAGLYIFEGRSALPGRPGLDGMYEVMQERLPLVPRYRQKVVEVPLGLNHPVWVDDPDFDLSFHVRRAALPRPGGMPELLEFAGRVFARPLDRSKPLWEMYVVEGLEDDRMALLTKVHHCMVDGIAGMDLGTVLFDARPEGSHPQPMRIEPPAQTPTTIDLVAQATIDGIGYLAGRISDAVRRPGSTLQTVLDELGLSSMLRVAGQLFDQAPPSPFNFPIGRYRRISITKHRLEDAKFIKNQLGGTVNDVVLTLVGEAVAHFAAERDEGDMPGHLRIMLPVSVRDDSQRMQLGNRVTAVFLNLPVSRMTARRRLAIIRETTADLKSGHQAVAADRMLAAATTLAPSSLHALAGRLAPLTSQRLFNLVVSNVPGVQSPLYSGGARLLETYPLLPLVPNTGVVICVTSYNGGMYFGLVADRDRMQDVDVLVEGIDRGFDRLMAAARRHARTEAAGSAPARAGAGRPAQGASRSMVQPSGPAASGPDPSGRRRR